LQTQNGDLYFDTDFFALLVVSFLEIIVLAFKNTVDDVDVNNDKDHFKLIIMRAVD